MRFIFGALVLGLSLGGFAKGTEKTRTADASESTVLLVSTKTMPDGGRATGTGTGFLIDSDLVLTCNHLLKIPTPRGVVDANKVELRLGDETLRARVEQTHPDYDLALLKLDKPVEGGPRPLSLRHFDLQPRADVRIVGNFPDQVRNTRGNLMRPHYMSGFALSSAKVYSGFSGGPVVDERGSVLGICSQRDDANNSIFVRSDIIASFLMQYSQKAGRVIACMNEGSLPLGGQPSVVPEPELKREQVAVDFEPSNGSAKVVPSKPVEEQDEVVIAIPVRPRKGEFVSKVSTAR